MTPPQASPPPPDRTLPPDDAARAMALRLLIAARHAALASTDPETGEPAVSRIALGRDPAGVPLGLVSALAPHSAALRLNPACALMLGEVPERGDPMAAPRLMIRARAGFVDADDPLRARLAEDWLRDHPKARLYIDLPDFSFVRLHPVSALLNGGFARAYRLSPADLGL